MPDGSILIAEIEQELNGERILSMLKSHCGQALQLAIDDCGGDGKTVDVAMLLARYEWHVHERMAQSATALGLTIDNRFEQGRREAHAEMAMQRAAAERAVEGAPATSRHPKVVLDAFTVGAALQLAKNLQLGVIAIAGKVRRGELPRLETRTEAVYLANAAGRAMGNMLALHVGLARLTDVPLVRAMREAVIDGFNDVFGPVAEAATGGEQN